MKVLLIVSMLLSSIISYGKDNEQESSFTCSALVAGYNQIYDNEREAAQDFSDYISQQKSNLSHMINTYLNIMKSKNTTVEESNSLATHIIRDISQLALKSIEALEMARQDNIALARLGVINGYVNAYVNRRISDITLAIKKYGLSICTGQTKCYAKLAGKNDENFSRYYTGLIQNIVDQLQNTCDEEDTPEKDIYDLLHENLDIYVNKHIEKVSLEIEKEKLEEELAGKDKAIEKLKLKF